MDLDELNLSDGQRVLDLGCGEGRHLHAMYFKAKVHAVGVDLGFDDVRKTREGFETYPDTEGEPNRFSLSVGNALALPFADDTFDVVVCSEVLEHIPDYQQAVKEITRILKPGGKLAVSVPRAWPERICWTLAEGYHNTPGGHVRIFNANRLKNDIQGEGLTFFRRHWAHGLHSPYWWLQCAIWNNRDTSKLVALYHRFLVWDIMKRPLLTRLLEKIADPLMGKSVVLYFNKGAAP
ncbi:MAG: class I SAM-dependent methyltransferase [Alphaproteobacteria bacterium]|nr:MAG: class I SAM-dependent methyltransferase [Alphaproteobacteria bacterium]